MTALLICPLGHKAEYEVDENAAGGIYPCLGGGIGSGHLLGVPLCSGSVAWKRRKDAKATSGQDFSQTS
jgi:hypothetical protein